MLDGAGVLIGQYDRLSRAEVDVVAVQRCLIVWREPVCEGQVLSVGRCASRGLQFDDTVSVVVIVGTVERGVVVSVAGRNVDVSFAVDGRAAARGPDAACAGVRRA